MTDDAEKAYDEEHAPPSHRRRATQGLGSLLIATGIVMLLLAAGITAWTRYRQDAETRSLLRRVSTPDAAILSFPDATPFPSTVSGALVPDTVRTPTAHAATRAAQPVATTADDRDRAIIANAPTVVRPGDAVASGETAAAPTPTPKPPMPKPTRLTIPTIRVDADIVEVGVSPIEIDGQQTLTWDVAPYAVGHHFSSAGPGEGENVVLSGHDDWEGEVFRNLSKLKQGDTIDLWAGDREIVYHVDEIVLLAEVGQPLEQRLANARFIGATGDERLTLVTCWPYGVDDHRLIVIARPG